jgi:hypothetical protein
VILREIRGERSGSEADFTIGFLGFLLLIFFPPLHRPLNHKIALITQHNIKSSAFIYDPAFYWLKSMGLIYI